MYIAVDFDGTLVKDSFPEIGEELPYAVETVKYFIKRGHKIILHTSRTHHPFEGHDALTEAEQWCKSKGIDLYAVNDNPYYREKYIKQSKVYADIYIDDHGIGVPLKNGLVDWMTIKCIVSLKERDEIVRD